MGDTNAGEYSFVATCFKKDGTVIGNWALSKVDRPAQKVSFISVQAGRVVAVP